MKRSEGIVLKMLDEMDQARSGWLSLDQLEQNLWRLRDEAGAELSPLIAAEVEDFVLSIRRRKEENLAAAGADETDEDRGTDALYQEFGASLHRWLQGGY